MQSLSAGVKSIPAILLNPFTYVALAMVIYGAWRQLTWERRLFGIRLHTLGELVLQRVGKGLGVGLLLSLFLLVPGVTLAPHAFFFLWIFALILALFGLRFLNFVYAGAWLGLLVLVTHWIEPPQYPWLEGLWASLKVIHLPALYLFIGLATFIQGILIAWSRPQELSPVWIKGKRGKSVGGYQWQPVWFVPVLYAAEVGAPFLPNWEIPVFSAQAALPSISGWPLLPTGSGGDYALFALPIVYSFQARIVASTPQNYLRFSANWLAGFGFLLAVISLAAYRWSWLAIVALLFSVAGFEGLHWVNRQRERKGQPAYVNPAQGIKILAVIPGSPAAKMGIKPGEVVVKVNGMAVNQPGQLYEALSKNKAFCKLEVTDSQGESRFPQCSLYEDDHHQLGLILAPDDQGASKRKTVLMD